MTLKIERTGNPSSSASISGQKRQNLPRIIKQLGMTQRDLAEGVGVSPAMISKYLAVGTNHVRLRPEKIQALVELLRRKLVNQREARNSGQGLAASSTDSHLGGETIRALETEVEELLAVENEAAELASFPVSPGGALPVSASNYVQRAADREINDILTKGRSPSSIVVAPINGGTSSFLNRVYQRAQSVSGSWVRIVHLDAEFAEEKKFTQVELFRYLFRKVGLPDTTSAKELDVADMKAAFDIWARDAWKENTRVVLIIDGLDQVFKNAGSIADPLALINWLSALRNEAALGEPPFNKLVLFVALTGKTWSAAHASPYASQAGELLLKKFTVEEVLQVFDQLNIDRSRYDAENVYDLFHGHPYLTQLFAWSMRNGSRAEEAERSSLAPESRYEAHWERLKSEIAFLIGTNYDLGEVLSAVLAVVDQRSSQPLHEKTKQIWRSYNRDLRVFGLLDGTPSEPKICRFYRNAIQSDQSQTPTNNSSAKSGASY